MNTEYTDKLFTYAHLPVHLQSISKPFYDLAMHLHNVLDNNPERTIALRKLLEAKDAAVRSKVLQSFFAEQPLIADNTFKLNPNYGTPNVSQENREKSK